MIESSSGLHDHVGYWLRRLSDQVHISFERKLAASGVTVSQWNVLVALYRGQGETVGELANFIGTDAAAVSRLVDRLQVKGMVERRVDPGSRRRIPLTLTEEARALVPQLIALAGFNDAQFFGTLTGEQRAALLSQLRQLTEHAISIIQETSTPL